MLYPEEHYGDALKLKGYNPWQIEEIDYAENF
jgi:hypothetical protein